MQHLQQPEKGLCLATCVAMVANCTVDEVVAECRILEGKKGIRYLPDCEAVKFLAKRMLWYGLRLSPNVKLPNDVVEFEVTMHVDRLPAILTVPSPTMEGFTHAVVWDNTRRLILDPLKTEPAEIEDYEIIEWTPVCEM